MAQFVAFGKCHRRKRREPGLFTLTLRVSDLNSSGKLTITCRIGNVLLSSRCKNRSQWHQVGPRGRFTPRNGHGSGTRSDHFIMISKYESCIIWFNNNLLSTIYSRNKLAGSDKSRMELTERNLLEAVTQENRVGLTII
jgi:hypothetical protein